LLGQQLRRLVPTLRLAFSPWAGTEQLPQLGGRLLDGTVVAQYLDRGSQAAPYLEFVEQFRRRFGEQPGFSAVAAHDATMLATRALAGASGPADVLAALRAARKFEGLQRSIELDAFGDSRAPMFLTELKEGAYASLAS
jgi:branched-chain amino acid transport system substrate-binding protein